MAGEAAVTVYGLKGIAFDARNLYCRLPDRRSYLSDAPARSRRADCIVSAESAQSPAAAIDADDSIPASNLRARNGCVVFDDAADRRCR